MKDPAQAIRVHLLNVPSVESGTWKLHIAHPPASPDTVILVNSVPGGRNPFPHLLYNEPSVQITVRGARSGYIAAFDKMKEVVAKLIGFSSVTLLGDMYRSCNQIGDVAYLGQDDNTRPMFSANFWFVVLPAAESGENRIPIT